jgi:hypothetical protein
MNSTAEIPFPVFIETCDCVPATEMVAFLLQVVAEMDESGSFSKDLKEVLSSHLEKPTTMGGFKVICGNYTLKEEPLLEALATADHRQRHFPYEVKLHAIIRVPKNAPSSKYVHFAIRLTKK